MGFDVRYTTTGMLKQTRLHSMDAQYFVEDRIDMVKRILSTSTWRLHNDLSSEAFDDGRKQVIGNCGAICDLKSLLVKIYQKRNVMVRLEEANIFLNVVRSITESITTVDNGYLILRY